MEDTRLVKRIKVALLAVPTLIIYLVLSALEGAVDWWDDITYFWGLESGDV